MTASARSVLDAFFRDVWNAHDVTRFDEYVSRNVLYHPVRGPTKGYDAYRAMAEAFVAAFPDLHFAVEDAIEAGDVVAYRLRITGTHTGGPHLGVPPTGRRVDVAGRPWLRVEHAKVAEVWPLYDERGMLEALAPDVRKA